MATSAQQVYENPPQPEGPLPPIPTGPSPVPPPGTPTVPVGPPPDGGTLPLTGLEAWMLPVLVLVVALSMLVGWALQRTAGRR